MRTQGKWILSNTQNCFFFIHLSTISEEENESLGNIGLRLIASVGHSDADSSGARE